MADNIDISSPRILNITFTATVILTLVFFALTFLLDLTFIDPISDPDSVREIIAAMTAEQRTAHAWITATVDILYPLAYGLLFAGAAIKYFSRAGFYLALPALLAIPADLIEGLIQILALTAMADWLWLKAIVTPIKTTLFLTGFFIAIAGFMHSVYLHFSQRQADIQNVE
ncbi:MAG: hypothetical protein HRU20_20620 [Pseudomonadales bacterium]|nr:hypothetical protein [Pseudomonadales bacterium]